ncbi:MAG: rod shape-determining protein MreD [Rhodospirillales bacterium]|nr:rod shape-determining protein MreD [Rhodospirillales bacterium]
MGEWLHSADRWLRGLIPVTVTVVFVFAGSLPWRLPGFDEVSPALAAMAIFYWTIYRPERLPYVATFAIGLLQDLLAGTPLGMTALVLLIVQGVVASQRTFFRGKPFLVVWWGFSLTMPAIGLLSWIIGSACFGTVIPLLPIMVQVGLTVLLFPVFVLFFRPLGALAAARPE